MTEICGNRTGLQDTAERAGEQKYTLFDLFEPGRLPLPFPQEIQLGTPDLTVTDDLDLFDHRGFDRKDPFHSDAKGDLPHRKGRAGARALSSDHVALEDLDPFLSPFSNDHMNLDRISDRKIGCILLDRILLNHIN